MTSLTVDMSSLADLLEGLRQIQVEIRRAYDSEWPAGSTAEFADRLWDRIRGSELTALVRCVLDLSRCQEYFTLNETLDALRIAGVSSDLLHDLAAIELELGARLVDDHWIQDHLTDCCWVHYEVRDRLLSLMEQPLVTIPAS